MSIARSGAAITSTHPDVVDCLSRARSFIYIYDDDDIVYTDQMGFVWTRFRIMITITGASTIIITVPPKRETDTIEKKPPPHGTDPSENDVFVTYFVESVAVVFTIQTRVTSKGHTRTTDIRVRRTTSRQTRARITYTIKYIYIIARVTDAKCVCTHNLYAYGPARVAQIFFDPDGPAKIPKQFPTFEMFAFPLVLHAADVHLRGYGRLPPGDGTECPPSTLPVPKP